MKPFVGGAIRPHEEGVLAQLRFWSNIGGSGISPAILERTGFWPQSVVDKLRERGIDTTQPIEQIFGGVIKFKPLPGREAQIRRERIMLALHQDLQIMRHAQYISDKIQSLLKEKWHADDLSFLPEDLEDEFKKMIASPSRYVIAQNPAIARQLLSYLPIINGWKNGYGYWSGLFKAANAMFSEMALYGASFALDNMAVKGAVPQKNTDADFISLEDMAEHVVEMIDE